MLDLLKKTPHAVVRVTLEVPRLNEHQQSRLVAYRSDRRLHSLTPAARDSFGEGLGAIEQGLHGPSLVVTWGVVMDLLHEKLWGDKYSSLNAILKRKKKLRARDSIHDVRDHDVLEACKELELLNQSRHRLLAGMLNERNRAGHVGAPGLTAEYALGFIERVLVECDQLEALALPPTA